MNWEAEPEGLAAALEAALVTPARAEETREATLEAAPAALEAAEAAAEEAAPAAEEAAPAALDTLLAAAELAAPAAEEAPAAADEAPPGAGRATEMGAPASAQVFWTASRVVAWSEAEQAPCTQGVTAATN